MQQAEIHSLQDRFLADMETIVAETTNSGARRVVMLSGGFDSFVLVVVLRNRFPDQPLETVTIRGAKTGDAAGAEQVAAHFNTDHRTVPVTVDEILANVGLAKGCGYASLRKLMSHVCYHLCLERHGVAGAQVYSGHAANVLYGNRQGIYDAAEAIAERDGCSVDEARTRLKAEFYAGYDSAGRHLAGVVALLGAAYRMPFGDPRLRYLSEAPYSVVRPWDMKFVKDALRRRYGLGDIVERRRTAMQAGTGLYKPLKARLKEVYREHGDNSDEIVARLTA